MYIAVKHVEKYKVNIKINMITIYLDFRIKITFVQKYKFNISR